jgi:predicted DNA binding CopG/RHH family protein
MEQGEDDDDMRDYFDFSSGRKNPYISMLKKQITIRIDDLTIAYFKDLSAATGIKYQQLINLYLSDCARKKLKPNISWEE